MKGTSYFFLLPLLLLGLALIAFPLVTSMPGKADAGKRMLSDLRPIIRAAVVFSMLVDRTPLAGVPLIHAGQERLADLEQLASLPDLRLLAWVFLVPGILLVLVATGMMALELRSARTTRESLQPQLS